MSDYIVNKAGAKIYSDVNKHAVLKVPALKKESENGVVHDVISVGMVQNGIALITIKQNGDAVAYRLPPELMQWAQSAVGMAMSGMKAFPAKVEFGILKGRCYAEIL